MQAKDKVLARLIRTARIDSHVLAILVGRSWTVVAGALTVFIIPLFLSATEQGYYYTFSSLIGLQILFELGLGQIILQLVSHEMGHLQIDEKQVVKGDEARIDYLASFTQLLRKWYLSISILFGLIAGVLGAYFLYCRAELLVSNWLGVWIVMIVSTSINLYYAPVLAFIEGCGQIGQVARMRLFQSTAGYCGLWLALFGNMGLWAACFVPLTAALVSTYWLRSAGVVFKSLKHRLVSPENALNWKRDLLPLQWRIGTSALSGYFIFYIMTPMVFANRGAAEAGQFGIAMAVFNALANIGTSWVYAATPQMAMHVSRKERVELNTLFRSVQIRALIATVTIAGGVLTAVIILRVLGIPQGYRISEPSVLLCLSIVCVANSVILSVAAYMRAHREEPMLQVSLFGGIATVFIGFLGSRHSVLAMSIGYAILNACVLLPWSLVLFSRYYRRH